MVAPTEWTGTHDRTGGMRKSVKKRERGLRLPILLVLVFEFALASKPVYELCFIHTFDIRFRFGIVPFPCGV